ncbi:MAG: hypothetical protein OXH95_03245 [bacterium]|nr:hypothetical protein [bacterium]MDE0643147.1 hypothetical protein [bacterium]
MDDFALYQHTQSWPRAFVTAIYLFVMAAFISMLLSAESGAIWWALLFVSVISLVIGTFSCLTVTVTYQELRLAFRFGWPSKLFELSRISAAEYHRVPWWYGLGIRITSKGWMWRIWGADTVLLTLPDRQFVIGTDDVDGLLRALGRSGHETDTG